MLQDLPDDILILCVDGSLRLAVKMSGTSKILGARLRQAAAPHGLRLVCDTPMTASFLEKYMGGRFHIGELVLPRWGPAPGDLQGYKQQMSHLHTVMVSPTLGPNFIRDFYFSCYYHYGFLGFAELEIEVCMRPCRRV